jgi:DNA polymerase III delta' subunit
MRSQVQSVIGHSQVLKYFQTVRKTDHLHHAYLFIGDEQLGKRTVALSIIRQLLCAHSSETGDDCHSCRLVQSGGHPDFFEVSRETSRVSIDKIRELSRQLNQTSVHGGLRLALCSNAERLSEPAMNALLKTLEEPPKRAMLFLTTSQPQQLLGTLRSRCYSLRFRRAHIEELCSALVAQGLDAKLAQDIATRADGRPGRAIQWAENPSAWAVERGTGEFAEFYEGSLEDRLQASLTLASGNFTEQQASLKQYLQRGIRDGRLALLESVRRSPGAKNTLGKAQFLYRMLQGNQLLQRNISPRLILEHLAHIHDN